MTLHVGSGSIVAAAAQIAELDDQEAAAKGLYALSNLQVRPALWIMQCALEITYMMGSCSSGPAPVAP
jgi:hypothetical protein